MTEVLHAPLPPAESPYPHERMCDHVKANGAATTSKPTMVMSSGSDDGCALRLSCDFPLHTRILCAANFVARFLGVTQKMYINPKDAEEFVPIKNGLRSIFIDTYRDCLSFIYTQPEMHRVSLERWQVSEICAYKDKGTKVKHEYLVVTLHDSDNNQAFLRLEHHIQLSLASIIHKLIDKCAALTDANQQKGGPRDEMTPKLPYYNFAYAFHENALPVNHFRLNNGHHISLPQLVVLACTIDKHCRKHRFSHNFCYWFCYVASEALKRRFPRTMVPIGGRDGHSPWCGVPVWTDANIDKVLEEYDQAWEEFVQKIDMIINNPNSPSAREARREAEEQRCRADQESRRAEQEEHKSRKLERELMELKAIIAQQTGKTTE